MNNPVCFQVFFRSYTLLILLIFLSCSSADEDFYLGIDFIESKSHVIVSDTFTTELSTVILDSFLTSGTGVALYGIYADTLFGKVACRSYFRLKYPSMDIREGDIYDSTLLILKNTGYSYGDTTLPQVLNVFRLTEAIISGEDSSCYNTTRILCDETPVGTKRFIPYPVTIESINVRIKDDFGLDLWNKAIENSNVYSSMEAFLYYFPGLVIAPGENTPAAIISFRAAEDDIILRIFSHRIGETVETLNTDFGLTNYWAQFNNIEADFTGTPLSLVKSQHEDAIASLTGNRSYIQGGTGLFAKIRFPYLQDFLLMENVKLLKATVTVHPDIYSYNSFPLPDSLILQLLDQHNRILGSFYNSNGELVIAGFNYDELYHEDTYYTYDISSYLTLDFSDMYFDADKSLAVSIHPDKLYTTFQRLILEKGKIYPKLTLYYAYY
jgi:hypothetical protein